MHGVRRLDPPEEISHRAAVEEPQVSAEQRACDPRAEGACEPLLQAGELVEVLPDDRAPPMDIAFLYPHRRQRSRRLLAFVEWFEELVQPHLE